MLPNINDVRRISHANRKEKINDIEPAFFERLSKKITRAASKGKLSIRFTMKWREMPYTASLFQKCGDQNYSVSWNVGTTLFLNTVHELRWG